MTKATCLCCFTRFKVSSSAKRKGKGKYCSPQCYRTAQVKGNDDNFLFMVGQHPDWDSGKLAKYFCVEPRPINARAQRLGIKLPPAKRKVSQEYRHNNWTMELLPKIKGKVDWRGPDGKLPVFEDVRLRG